MKLKNKKTGEVVEAYKEGPIDLYFYPKEHDEKDLVDRKTYQSLAELNAEWEDYEPKDPLIKDEKIRKAVRAWAEAVGEEEAFIVSYNIEYHDCCIYTGNLSNTATIDLGTDFNIKEGSYTIAELCGEEEE